MGRPPAWNPVSLLDSKIWLETVEMATLDRLILPIEVRRRLGWKRVTRTVSLLAILNDEGAIELLRWEPEGRAEMERVSRALNNLPQSEHDEIMLAAMDRYSRASLLRDGRVRLPAALGVHLGISGEATVRVAASNGRVWLWPEAVWHQARLRRFERLNRALSNLDKQPKLRLDTAA